MSLKQRFVAFLVWVVVIGTIMVYGAWLSWSYIGLVSLLQAGLILLIALGGLGIGVICFNRIELQWNQVAVTRTLQEKFIRVWSMSDGIFFDLPWRKLEIYTRTTMIFEQWRPNTSFYFVVEFSPTVELFQGGSRPPNLEAIRRWLTTQVSLVMSKAPDSRGAELERLKSNFGKALRGYTLLNVFTKESSQEGSAA